MLGQTIHNNNFMKNRLFNFMTAIEFVQFYPEIVNEIESVSKTELKPVFDEMRKIDPHDLISPDGYFDRTQAVGYVFSLFNTIRKQKFENERKN